jgi:hypothetical protein
VAGNTIVRTNQGGHDVNVVIGMPDSDPTHPMRIIPASQTSVMHDLLSHHLPLGITQPPVIGMITQRHVIDRLRLPQNLRHSLHRRMQHTDQPAKIPPTAARIQPRLQGRRLPGPRRHDVRIDMLVIATRPIQVPQQPAGFASLGQDPADHCTLLPSCSTMSSIRRVALAHIRTASNNQGGASPVALSCRTA